MQPIGRNAVNADQLPLFSHNLPSLKPKDVVRVIAEDWIGEVAQIWPGRDHYVVFAKSLPMYRPLPTYRRDELELLGEEERVKVWER